MVITSDPLLADEPREGIGAPEDGEHEDPAPQGELRAAGERLARGAAPRELRAQAGEDAPRAREDPALLPRGARPVDGLDPEPPRGEDGDAAPDRRAEREEHDPLVEGAAPGVREEAPDVAVLLGPGRAGLVEDDRAQVLERAARAQAAAGQDEARQQHEPQGEPRRVGVPETLRGIVHFFSPCALPASPGRSSATHFGLWCFACW